MITFKCSCLTLIKECPTGCFPMNIANSSYFYRTHPVAVRCRNEIGYKIGYDKSVILKENTKYTISIFLTEFKKACQGTCYV